MTLFQLFYGEAAAGPARLSSTQLGRAWRVALTGVAIGFVFTVLAGCQGMYLPKQATSLSEINEVPRFVQRHVWLESEPWGQYTTQKPDRITLLDSGNDAGKRKSAQYLPAWNQYLGSGGYSDAPVHYIVDREGYIWIGRNVVLMGELYTRDRFSHVHPFDDSRGDDKRHWGREIPLEGHILVMATGNFDTDTLTPKQEPVLVQLLNHLCKQHEISPTRIGVLSQVAPGPGNPGKNLAAYAKSGIFQKYIREPVKRSDTNPFSFFNSGRP